MNFHYGEWTHYGGKACAFSVAKPTRILDTKKPTQSDKKKRYSHLQDRHANNILVLTNNRLGWI